MKVQLERSFVLPASADVAWAFLQDIEAVTVCMPGARITERIDEQHYRGTVAVKVGPASMSFKGTVEVRDIDAGQKSLRLIGKGTDSTGSSGASMDLLARIEAGEARTSTLVGNSTVSMSGKAATFGGRMMNAVADQVLKQFVDNFAARVSEREAGRSPETAPKETAARQAPSADASPVPSVIAGAESVPSADTGAATASLAPSANTGATSSPSAPASAGAAPAQRVAAPPPPLANELNGLALAWAVLKDWLRSLFSGKKA